MLNFPTASQWVHLAFEKNFPFDISEVNTQWVKPCTLSFGGNFYKCMLFFFTATRLLKYGCVKLPNCCHVPYDIVAKTVGQLNIFFPPGWYFLSLKLNRNLYSTWLFGRFQLWWSTQNGCYWYSIRSRQSVNYKQNYVMCLSNTDSTNWFWVDADLSHFWVEEIQELTLMDLSLANTKFFFMHSRSSVSATIKVSTSFFFYPLCTLLASNIGTKKSLTKKSLISFAMMHAKFQAFLGWHQPV